MPSIPTAPSRRLLEPEVARVVGVLPLWLDPMTAHLRFPAPVGARRRVRAWDLDAVDTWLRRPERARPTPTISEPALRWLILRMVAPWPAASLAKAAGVPRAEVERESVRLAVHLVTRVPYPVQQQWARDHRAGSTDEEIATRTAVGVTLVRLVLDGIPPPVPGGRINPYLLRRLWDEGLAVPVIAERVGRSVSRTRAEINDGSTGLAPRLTALQISARFGWTRTNVRGLRQHPHFPAPDGHPLGAAMGKGTWWWAATIDRWEAGVTLRRCPVCGARVQRLGTHRAKHRSP